jgi:hypothetical protein
MYIIEARDTGATIPSPDTSFAILLSNPVSGGASVFVEITDEDDDEDGKAVVRWKCIVTVSNQGECIVDVSVAKGEEFCLEGEYIPFRRWIVD